MADGILETGLAYFENTAVESKPNIMASTGLSVTYNVHKDIEITNTPSVLSNATPGEATTKIHMRGAVSYLRLDDHGR